MNQKTRNSGWEQVADWYNHVTGHEGHYYQKEIIIPKVLAFLKKNQVRKILDLASGQGVLEKAIPLEMQYCGVDISPSLIKEAEKNKKSVQHKFLVGDITEKNFSLEQKDYDAVTVILSLQDIADPQAVFHTACQHLKKNGILILVMNHPSFRIPRQSSWHLDEANKMQSRLMKGYMSSFQIPISVNPGKGKNSEQVVYHHHPLSKYSMWLKEENFVIEEIEEWISNKESTGPKAKMENRARSEFPLFLAMICRKKE